MVCWRGYTVFKYCYFSSLQRKIPVHVLNFLYKNLQHFSIFIIVGWVHTAGDVQACAGGDGGVQSTSGDKAAADGEGGVQSTSRDKAAAGGVQTGCGLQAGGGD